MVSYSRFRKVRKKANLTQKQVADKLGIKYQVYQRWESGKVLVRDPEMLEKLAFVLGTTVEYLTNTEILPIYQQLSESRQANTISFATEQLEKQKQDNKIIQIKNSLIPYEVATEQALSAGLGEGYTDNIETTTFYWDKLVDYDIGIPIKGDSMEPDYQSGQIALIKYQSRSDYDGQVCAVDNISVGNAFIKCVTCQEDGILLESLNVELNQYGERKFPDKKISWEDNPRIIGKVVAAFTPIEINNIF